MSQMFVVVYARGGAANARWCRTLPMVAVAAEEACANLVRAGYPAHVRRADDLSALPKGPDPEWDYSKLQWR